MYSTLQFNQPWLGNLEMEVWLPEGKVMIKTSEKGEEL